MTYQLAYWDKNAGQMLLRDCTDEEVAEIVARENTPPTREELKAQRQAAVDAITVTVNDKVFDGDETSQDRMARALKAADILDQPSCMWVLHDNTPTEVTREELEQALAASILAQAALWVIPS